MMLLFICAALAQPSYMQLERYDTFPEFVRASSFRPITDDRSEIALRAYISRAVYDAIRGSVIASSGNMYVGGPYVIPTPAPTPSPSGAYVAGTNADGILQRGIRVSVGFRETTATVNYRILRKLYSELLERNITFLCDIPGVNAFIPFTDMDPYGPMPGSIMLKQANSTSV